MLYKWVKMFYLGTFSQFCNQYLYSLRNGLTMKYIDRQTNLYLGTSFNCLMIFVMLCYLFSKIWAPSLKNMPKSQVTDDITICYGLFIFKSCKFLFLDPLGYFNVSSMLILEVGLLSLTYYGSKVTHMNWNHSFHARASSP